MAPNHVELNSTLDRNIVRAANLADHQFSAEEAAAFLDPNAQDERSALAAIAGQLLSRYRAADRSAP